MLITLSERCIGTAHIKQNKPLQDYAAATSDRLKSYAYAFVADGHGGVKYIRSSKGAEIAVHCAVDSINGVLKEIFWDVGKKKHSLIEKNLKLICIKISLKWKESVIKHYSENPLSKEETDFLESLNITLPLEEEDITFQENAVESKSFKEILASLKQKKTTDTTETLEKTDSLDKEE